MAEDLERWSVRDYLAAVRRGDPDAPERFWRCARRLAFASARRRFLSREDAEDAAMAAYCAASENDHAALQRVKPATTPLPRWLGGVLKHHLSKELRRVARAKGAPPADLEAGRVAQRARLAMERATRLGRAATSRRTELTPKQRHAFELYLEGLPSSGIAARLGITRDAALDRIRRAWAHMLSGSPPSIRASTAELLGPAGPRMDPDERATLEAMARGQTYRQVASDRGESPGAVRCRVQRVRRRARKRP